MRSNVWAVCAVTLFTAAVAFAAAFGTAWAGSGTDGVTMVLQPDDNATVRAGEPIYQESCASCHGAQMQGQPDWRIRGSNGLLPAPPHDASGHTWHHADDLLFEITKYGPGTVIGDDSYQSAMPAFENTLSDADIVAVLSFIKNSWPLEQRSWQDEVNGTQNNGINSIKKKPGLLDRLLK